MHTVMKSKSNNYPKTSTSRPKVFKSWNDECMKLAILGVSEGMSVRRAAYEFGVPKSTLQDRISGRVGLDAKSGPERCLNDSEEEKLVNFLVGCSRIGYARSKKQVLAIVSAVLSKKRGIDENEVIVTKGWWSSFQKRHPKLSLRSAESLSYARAVAEDPEILNMYYDLLERTLQDNNLLGTPHLLFNCDETGFSLEHKPGKLIGVKGMKHLNATTSGDKAQMTVLACVSASGYSMPPMVIFDRKRLKPDHTHGEIPGTIYGLSPNGWIDGELFEEWFTRHFLLHVPAMRPVLLLLDGHSSHYQPSFIQRAAKERVIIFCLPSHTTHLLQPLDQTCFSPLKGYWNEECQKYMSRNPGRVINRFNFSEIFAEAWKKAMIPSTIVSGFRATGVYPFSRKAVDTIIERRVEEQSSEVAYVPFSSPVVKQSNVLPNKFMHDFTDEELKRYQHRFEEGFNIPGDHRYEKWLSLYHSETWSEDESSMVPGFPKWYCQPPESQLQSMPCKYPDDSNFDGDNSSFHDQHDEFHSYVDEPYSLYSREMEPLPFSCADILPTDARLGNLYSGNYRPLPIHCSDNVAIPNRVSKLYLGPDKPTTAGSVPLPIVEATASCQGSVPAIPFSSRVYLSGPSTGWSSSSGIQPATSCSEVNISGQFTGLYPDIVHHSSTASRLSIPGLSTMSGESCPGSVHPAKTGWRKNMSGSGTGVSLDRVLPTLASSEVNYSGEITGATCRWLHPHNFQPGSTASQVNMSDPSTGATSLCQYSLQPYSISSQVDVSGPSTVASGLCQGSVHASSTGSQENISIHTCSTEASKPSQGSVQTGSASSQVDVSGSKYTGASSSCQSSVQTALTDSAVDVSCPNTGATALCQGSVQSGSTGFQLDVSGPNSGASSSCQSSVQTGSTGSQLDVSGPNSGASSLCDSIVPTGLTGFQGSIFLPSSRASKSRQGSVQTGSVSSQVDVSGLNTGASSLCQSSLQTGSTASQGNISAPNQELVIFVQVVFRLAQPVLKEACQDQIQELASHVKAVFRLTQLIFKWMFQTKVQELEVYVKVMFSLAQPVLKWMIQAQIQELAVGVKTMFRLAQLVLKETCQDQI